jgi:hypothetical protein
MRNLMLACGCIALVAGITSVNLWRELRAERTLTAGLRSRLEQLAVPGAVPPAPSIAVLPLAEAGGAAPPPRPAPGSSAADPAHAAARPLLSLNNQELLKDPEYRKARLAQARLTLPQNYPGLAEELGLTPDEADSLFDLLAENQVSSLNTLPIGVDGQLDQAAMQEFSRTRQAAQAQLEQSLASLLGSTRHAQWTDYQATRPARMQVEQLGRTFQSMGLSLSDEQRRPLVAAYILEQKRQQDDRRSMSRDLSQAALDPQARRAQLQEESLRQQAESNRRLLETASSHLSPQQTEALRTSLEEQLAMNRASATAQRRQQEIQAQRQGGSAGGVVVEGAGMVTF